MAQKSNLHMKEWVRDFKAKWNDEKIILQTSHESRLDFREIQSERKERKSTLDYLTCCRNIIHVDSQSVLTAAVTAVATIVENFKREIESKSFFFQYYSIFEKGQRNFFFSYMSQSTTDEMLIGFCCCLTCRSQDSDSR